MMLGCLLEAVEVYNCWETILQFIVPPAGNWPAAHYVADKPCQQATCLVSAAGKTLLVKLGKLQVRLVESWH